MSSAVKPGRRYDARGRQEQARRNRLVVIDTARELFLEQGFAATTMPEIASAAGVSVQTVYKVFGSKPALAKAVFDVAIAGDDQPVPMVERDSLTRVCATSPTCARNFGSTGSIWRPSPHAMSRSSWSSSRQPRPTPRPAGCGASSRTSGCGA